MHIRKRIRKLSQRIVARINGLLTTRDGNGSSASLPNPSGLGQGLFSPPQNSVAIRSDTNVPATERGRVRRGHDSTDPLELVAAEATEGLILPSRLANTTRSNKQEDTEASKDPRRDGGTEDWGGLRGLVTVLDQCKDAFGPLRAVVNQFIACIEMYQTVAGGRSDFKKLQTEFEALFQDLQQHYSGNIPPSTTTSMESLCRSIMKELAYVKEQQDRTIARQVLEAGEDVDQALACYRRIQGHLQRFTLNANLAMWKTTDELATNARLDRLSPAFSAFYKSNQALELKRGECTPGTRVEVLAQMHGWIHNRAATPVYWLNGMAGTGKTTIAYTLCAELELVHNLGASFFCSRSLPECRDVNRIVPSIAYQLAQFSQPFRYALSRVLETERDVHTQLLRIQFEKLVVKPIQEVQNTLPEDLVVVIDALDECDSKKSTRQILEILLTKTINLPIKFFMASRPEPEIRELMKKQAGRKAISRLVLHELDKGTVQGDIETYLRAALQQIEPLESEIKALTERAGILFIYAATVVRYISYADFTKNPRKRLRNVLEVSSTAESNPYQEIDELYTLVLVGALDDPALDASERADTKQMLYTALCAHEPLTTSALSGLLGLHDIDRVHAALAPLWSVLHVVESSGLVTTLHASFPDYMFDPSRSKQYHCDRLAHDHALTKHCFDCLRDTQPQFNICGLESSCIPDNKIKDLDVKIKTSISTEVLYACRYWEAHLQHAAGSSEVLDRLGHFLTTQLLLWMEVANLHKYIIEGMEMLRRAEEWCLHQPSSENLKELVHEAWRFITAFVSGPLSQSTPHIYVSMLPFWPESSLITKHYARRMQNMIRPEGTALSRPLLSLLATWVLTKEASSLTWSPDSSRLAFVSGGEIHIRDSLTGRPVLVPLNQTSLLGSLSIITHTITSIGYSSDGTRIVSGSDDGTLCVWDPDTGKKLLGPLKGHTQKVMSVTFSSDGKRIASGSYDSTVRIWDARTGKKLLDSLKGHSDSVKSIAFSPNCTLIVSGSDDRTLQIWDARTGQPVLSPLKGHTGWVLSVAFSPDSTRIISGSGDETIRVWDARTGQSLLRPFKGHASWVSSVAFSPDGTHVITGSWDNTIRIWDAQTGELVLSPFEGHTRPVISVACSPDGARIASTSEDRSVRIWDARIKKQNLSSLKGYTNYIDSVAIALSPDGCSIVSGSKKDSIQIWDVKTGKSMLNSHKECASGVISVAFSPDGTRIVFGSNYSTIQMRDAKNGESMLRPFGGHTGRVRSVSFSPDSTRIASGSDDNTIRMWDAQTGEEMLSPFEGHADRVNSVTFSPDSTRIVSGSNDHTIRVWDAQTGELVLNSIKGHTNNVNSVAFSPDGTCIASGSSDNTIGMWDAHTGKSTMSPFKGHTGSVWSVAFSPDGTRVASGSSDGTIRIWDAQTGQPIFEPLKGHTHDVHSVAFSPDGTRVVSGSHDATIRVWDVCAAAPMPSSSVLESPFSWEITEDGWVVDSNDNSKLLVWVPPDLRHLLLPPRGISAMSTQSHFRLGFEDAFMGTWWARSYRPGV